MVLVPIPEVKLIFLSFFPNPINFIQNIFCINLSFRDIRLDCLTRDEHSIQKAYDDINLLRKVSENSLER